jgi:hypothetical protein
LFLELLLVLLIEYLAIFFSIKWLRHLGIVTSAITNPVWVVKTRMQLQIQQRMAQRQPEHYRGLIGIYKPPFSCFNSIISYQILSDALRRIPQEEGIPALYKVFRN